MNTEIYKVIRDETDFAGFAIVVCHGWTNKVPSEARTNAQAKWALNRLQERYDVPPCTFLAAIHDQSDKTLFTFCYDTDPRK